MTSVDDVYRCTPRETREFMKQVIEAGLVPFLQSSPGMGKSTITLDVFAGYKLWPIDHRLSTSAPEDLSGLPHFTKDGKAVFAPFEELFPLTDTKIPDGYQGWGLFLDEFNAADKSVQAAAYKLILDRKVGQHKLHDNVVVVAAGNLSTDRSIVNPLSTAMQSRLVHIEMMISFEEWLQDVAIKQKYDRRVVAFLNAYPDRLMDFRPDHNEKTFCCPRTWEFVNRLIKDRPDLEDKQAKLLTGVITSGVAVDFVQFTKIFDTMVTLEEILKEPLQCRIPKGNNEKWAVITSMMEHITEKNFKDLTQYADRFDLAFRVVFYRSALVRQPALRTHPAFAIAMSSLSKYLHGA